MITKTSKALTPNKKPDISFLVKFTEEEKSNLKKNASKLNKNQSELIREALIESGILEKNTI